MLHAIDSSKMKSTLWCVPSAISLLTGYPVEKTHSRAAFLQKKAYKDVSGVYMSESILMLHELGYKLSQIDLAKRYAKLQYGPTIKRFLSELQNDEFSSPLLIFTHDHALTSHMGWVADNWTKHPVRMKNFPQLKRLVVNAYIVA